jgi:uncharacterized membrane protein
MKKLIKSKKGVFGLNAVQSFFAIILGLAILAYVIVLVMGTLGTASILSGLSGSYVNDSLTVVDTGTNLTRNAYPGCSATITSVYNSTHTLCASGNYSTTGCTITNLTGYCSGKWNITYTYTYNSQAQVGSRDILQNTSFGITSFFASISPVYAILAVLVIILILVVLVRVVQAPNREGSSPSL